MFLKKIIPKLLLFSALIGVGVPLVNAATVYANEVTVVEEVDTAALTENMYLTGYLDENDELQYYSHIGKERWGGATIVVLVKGIVIGYLSAVVIDGIVIAATGKSGGEWVAVAIRNVVGKRYTGSVSIPSGPYTCPGVVIDHSGMCP